MDANIIIAAISLIVVYSTALVGSVIFVVKQNSSSEDKLSSRIVTLEDKIHNIEDKIMNKITKIEDNFHNIIEKTVLDERKERHALSNTVTGIIGNHYVKVESLDRDAARKDDLKNLEMRVSSTLSKMESTFDRVTLRLETLPVMERDIKSLTSQIDKLLSIKGVMA